MEALKQYIISITSAAIICSVLVSIMEKNASQKLIKILCGVFLSCSFLNPIVRLNIPDIIHFPQWIIPVDYPVEEGTAYARNSVSGIIKERLESYILDKAALMGEKISVEIRLTEDDIPVPESIIIEGHVSQHFREKMESILENDLGVDRENQTWIELP